MMSKKVFDHVIGREGGFVNDPADRGGATKFGITIGTYSRWLGRPASVEEVKKMPLNAAIEIYESNYWKPLGLDKVHHDGVACAIFDQGVNRGITTIARAVQKIVRTTVDGHVGPKTLAAINGYDSEELIEAIACNAEATYKAIAAKNPSQKRFLKGWLNRANHLRTLKEWD